MKTPTAPPSCKWQPVHNYNTYMYMYEHTYRACTCSICKIATIIVSIFKGLRHTTYICCCTLYLIDDCERSASEGLNTSTDLQPPLILFTVSLEEGEWERGYTHLRRSIHTCVHTGQLSCLSGSISRTHLQAPTPLKPVQNTL